MSVWWAVVALVQSGDPEAFSESSSVKGRGSLLRAAAGLLVFC
jgi:hypothetical protein